MVHRIDYSDHYSYCDTRLCRYHFLRFSERDWRPFNSCLCYQNRLRHCDYVRLMELCGFSLLLTQVVEPSEQEIQRLLGMGLAREFRDYSLPELGIREATIAVRPGLAPARGGSTAHVRRTSAGGPGFG